MSKILTLLIGDCLTTLGLKKKGVEVNSTGLALDHLFGERAATLALSKKKKSNKDLSFRSLVEAIDERWAHTYLEFIPDEENLNEEGESDSRKSK